MKLEKELPMFLQFCKEHQKEVQEFYDKVVTSKCYVKSPIDYVSYDLVRYYCYKKYNKTSYCILYDKYNADDTHILTFGKQGLKAINIA